MKSVPLKCSEIHFFIQRTWIRISFEEVRAFGVKTLLSFNNFTAVTNERNSQTYSMSSHADSIRV